MTRVEHRLSLDIRKECHSNSLRVKRDDTARRLRILLTNGIAPYVIAPDCYAVFSAIKPDGNRIFNPCTIEDNRIVYDLTPQTTAVEGVVECEIRLYGADDLLITSPGFELIVDEALYDEDKIPQSETEVSALTGLISDAAEVIAEGRELIGDYSSALAMLEGVRDEAEASAKEAAKQAQTALNANRDLDQKMEAAEEARQGAENAAEAAELAETEAKQAFANASSAANRAAQSVGDAAREADRAERAAELAKEQVGTAEIVEVVSRPPGSDPTLEETDDSTPAARKYILGVPRGITGVGIRNTIILEDPIAHETSVTLVYSNGEEYAFSIPHGNGGGGSDPSQSVDLTGYAKEQWVQDGFQPKGN